MHITVCMCICIRPFLHMWWPGQDTRCLSLLPSDLPPWDKSLTELHVSILTKLADSELWGASLIPIFLFILWECHTCIQWDMIIYINHPSLLPSLTPLKPPSPLNFFFFLIIQCCSRVHGLEAIHWSTGNLTTTPSPSSEVTRTNTHVWLCWVLVIQTQVLTLPQQVLSLSIYTAHHTSHFNVCKSVH